MRSFVIALVAWIACTPATPPPLANRAIGGASASDADGIPYAGDPNARVVLVSYFNYRCPHCRTFEPKLDAIVRRYGDRIAVYYKVLRLRPYPDADDAAVAAFAAHRQGKFLAMHRALIAGQAFARDELRGYARQVGLDLERFDRDFGDPTLRTRIDRDYADAEAAGVAFVPFLFIDGVPYDGDFEIDAIAAVIDRKL